MARKTKDGQKFGRKDKRREKYAKNCYSARSIRFKILATKGSSTTEKKEHAKKDTTSNKRKNKQKK